MPADAPLRRIGRVLGIGVLLYLLPPLGIWWTWRRTLWPTRRKTVLTAATLLWLPLWTYAMWIAATADYNAQQDRPTATTTTATRTAAHAGSDVDGAGGDKLAQWWARNRPRFELMNEDLHTIAEAGRAKNQPAMADACNALWGSLSDIESNLPPVASVRDPLIAYLDAALPGSEACYQGLDNGDSALFRSASEQLAEAAALFDDFKTALTAQGLDY